jgi:UPF0755 protein
MAAARKKTGKSKKQKRGMMFKIIVSLVIVLMLSTVGAFVYFYEKVFRPNVFLSEGKTDYLFIKTTDTFTDVVNQLVERNLLRDKASFVWLSEYMKYDQGVKAGKYLIKNQMSNKELVQLLRSGKQEPVKIVLHAIRTKHELAGKIAKQLEADSLGLIRLLNDDGFLSKFGLDSYSAISLFIPDTYEFYWNTPNDKFIERMQTYYEKFWNDERKAKARAIGLKPAEVSTLASIVQMETNKGDEKPRVAGVYMNRIRIGMPLQADPTVIFGIGDFTIKRVSSADTKHNSPYNTYQNKGLPPGPIYLPTKQSIDAVLNFEKHNYLYFCARDDFSGYHTFTNDYNQHLANARKYHKALNKRNIRR